jgi:hypothetical protein
MGRVEADGTRTAGIANLTIEALVELGIMGVGLDQVATDAVQNARLRVKPKAGGLWRESTNRPFIPNRRWDVKTNNHL